MARKSRVAVLTTSEDAAQISERIPTAIYARLSVENSGKSAGTDVIVNQIEICKEYVRANPQLELIETYVENGRTGTNFDRPSFHRLLADVKSGKIKCLVVRDLSRFGRDYIETGTYLERIFPTIGLRFIAIKEQYDSSTVDPTNEALMVPLQNMINALYSKDISKKVATAHKVRMATPDFKKSILPYGYKLDETRTEIIVDEETAVYVKLIYQWKLEGLTIPSIMKRLCEQNAPNVNYQKAKTGVSTRKNVRLVGWSRSTVERILENPIYIGDTVVGKTEQALYKGAAAKVWNAPSKWTVFPNTHEALISREDFACVSKIIEDARMIAHQKREASENERCKLVDMFEGKIFCADCSRRMYFKRDKRNGVWRACYKCSGYAMKKEPRCASHFINATDLEEKVLSAIKMQIKVALDYEKLLLSLKGSEGAVSIRGKQNALVASIQLRLNGVQKKRTRLYEDFADGILSEEEYSFAKVTYDTEFDKLSLQLEDAVACKKRFDDAMSSNNKWIKLMKSVSKVKRLSQSLVDESIDKVLVFENGAVELVMKYADVYALTVQGVQEVQEVAG